MRELLLLFVEHFGFLYQSPDRRIVNSGTPHARAAEAFLDLRSSFVTWRLAKDRFSLRLGVGVTSDDVFSTELIQQYLEHLPERPSRHLGSGMPGLAWIEGNVDTIELLFADEQRAATVSAELDALREANAERRWGPIPRREE